MGKQVKDQGRQANSIRKREKEDPSVRVRKGGPSKRGQKRGWSQKSEAKKEEGNSFLTKERKD